MSKFDGAAPLVWYPIKEHTTEKDPRGGGGIGKEGVRRVCLMNWIKASVLYDR